MNANQYYGRLDITRFPVWWASLVNADFRLRKVQNLPAAFISSVSRLRMLSWFFCVTVWVSSLAAIWMSRGLIGLFVSGQVLSAGACLFKDLAKRTPSSVSSSNRAERAFHRDTR